MMSARECIQTWFQDHEADVKALRDSLAAHPEPAKQEFESVRICTEFLKKYGFEVTTGGELGAPTAFRAASGAGKPVIGILAEYDALPGLGQQLCSTTHQPVQGAGHGCGHCLLGTGSIAAACALKYALEQTGISGTVVCYGTPAEEIMYGKNCMLQFGQFRELDACITWHPADRNCPGMICWQAIDIIRFQFRGKTAHAAGNPWDGRSALDAAELTNIGTQFLREHLHDGIRHHYTYLHGGEAPNVVPDYAELNYFVRAQTREMVDDTTARIVKCAKGAAMMTETEVTWEFDCRARETIVNHVLAKHVEEIFTEIGWPDGYSREETQWAQQLSKNVDPSLPGKMAETADPASEEVQYFPGSTDFSDVSWVVPSVCFGTATWPVNLPGHHWAVTASTGTSIALKGTVAAAKTMAYCAADLMQQPKLLHAATEEYKTRLNGRKWSDLSARPEEKNDRNGTGGNES